MNGRIIKGIGGFYYVKTATGVIECKPRGIFRKSNTKPLVGDLVDISLIDSNSGIIDSIKERKNYLIRPPIANVDQLFIVVSTSNPSPDLFFIDKIIVTSEFHRIDPVILVNKIDLTSGEEIKNIYESAGFKVIITSALNKFGIDSITASFSGKVIAFTGHSGVGKSSILQSIYPDFTIETGEVSQKIGRGRHTTREVQLFETDNGSFIADTPGFSSIELCKYLDINKDQLAFYFRDFMPFIDNCRFSGCMHIKERDCAIINAVNEGKISISRYESYKRLYDEFKNIKEWDLK